MKTTFPECPNERRFPRITSEEELAECGFRFSGQASSTQSTPKEHHHEIEPLINSNKEITVNSEMGFSSWRRSKSLAVRHWNFIDLIRKEVRGFSLKLYRFFNIYTFDVEENGDDDDYDEYLQQPEKKRRLFIKEVQCLKNSFETDNMLQNSFETDNKLEADRKIQLAKELGLQLRQVTIWFQNRRARGKTKQMEKDFDKWQAKFNHIKCNHGSLLRKKEKAQS